MEKRVTRACLGTAKKRRPGARRRNNSGRTSANVLAVQSFVAKNEVDPCRVFSQRSKHLEAGE